MADRRKQQPWIASGAHQQSAGPLTALRKRQVQIRFVDLAQVQTAHVSGNANHLTAGNERIAFAGKRHRALVRSDSNALADRIFVWPEAASSGLADDHYERLPLRFARAK